MLSAFSTPRNRNRTFMLLALCILLAVAAVVVGIDDNLPGVLLAYLAGAALTLAFVHAWRRAGPYRGLMLAAVAGFIGFAILHNVFHAFASMSGESGFAHDLFGVIGVVCFFVALLLCPPAFLVGLAGNVVMWRRERRA